jgi:DNA-binding response OmpR family regulator
MGGNKNIKVLIIDDSILISKVYTEELISEGFDVITSSDGAKGLELALKEKPDIILLDIIMPVMDGLTMMDKLRNENQYGKKVPIILLTSLSPNEEKIMNEIVKDEPAYYLIKSECKPSDVVEKIRERLGRS